VCPSPAPCCSRPTADGCVQGAGSPPVLHGVGGLAQTPHSSRVGNQGSLCTEVDEKCLYELCFWRGPCVTPSNCSASGFVGAINEATQFSQPIKLAWLLKGKVRYSEKEMRRETDLSLLQSS